MTVLIFPPIIEEIIRKKIETLQYDTSVKELVEKAIEYECLHLTEKRVTGRKEAYEKFINEALEKGEMNGGEEI
jgi:hypothetical protein